MQPDPQLKTPYMTDERMRRYRRHRVRVFVKVFTPTGETLEGISNDVSEGGMALYVSRRFDIGQPVRLEFRVPTSLEYVNLPALVRASNGFRCGVEFHDVGVHELTLRKSCEELASLLSVPSSAQSPDAI